jgi:integrase
MRTQSKLPIWLTKEELATVVAAASRNLRDQIALEFCVTFALRRSELTSLRLKNLADGMIRCERAKGSLPVHQFIPASLAAKLAEYLAGEGITDPEAFVFPNGQRGDNYGAIDGETLNRIFKKYAASLPAAKRHVHCLRHTGIAAYYRATKDLMATAKFSGHVNPVHVQTYAALSPEESAKNNRSVLDSMFAVAA